MNMNNDKKGQNPENETVEVYNKTTRTVNALKKGKFNFVDAFLVLVILAAVVTLVAYFLPGIASHFTQDTEYPITYVIEFRGVDADVVTDDIKSGMKVYDSQNHYEIGTVSAVEIKPNTVLVKTEETYEDGTVVGSLVENPGFMNVSITVVGNAIYSEEDESILVNGQRIAVGREFHIRLGGFTGSGYCTFFVFEPNSDVEA